MRGGLFEDHVDFWSLLPLFSNCQQYEGMLFGQPPRLSPHPPRIGLAPSRAPRLSPSAGRARPRGVAG